MKAQCGWHRYPSLSSLSEASNPGRVAALCSVAPAPHSGSASVNEQPVAVWPLAFPNWARVVGQHILDLKAQAVDEVIRINHGQ